MNVNNFFALNHILAPNLTIKKFFKLSNKLDIQNVEIRNDLPSIFLDKIEPSKIKKISSDYKIKIISINALQKFNIWNQQRKKEILFL